MSSQFWMESWKMNDYFRTSIPLFEKIEKVKVKFKIKNQMKKITNKKQKVDLDDLSCSGECFDHVKKQTSEFHEE
jgi:hypothetical protein